MKRTLCLLLAVTLLLSACSVGCLAATPDAFPVADLSPQRIVGAVENKIEEIYWRTGTSHTIHFPFSPENYRDIQDFKEQISQVMHPLMTAVFAADMSGRDHITVRTAYSMLSSGGKARQYYYTVELTVHTAPELLEELERLLRMVDGLSPAEQVDALQTYLYENITYDEGTIDASGSMLALIGKRAVCMGYSRALMELCRQLRIPCIALVNETHMWNAVFVEGRWQMLDVTWNIPRCEIIDQKGHGYDPGVYERAQNYYQNQYLNRGFVKIIDFTDLQEQWYRIPVAYTLGRGLFYGESATRFAPHRPMTRGMFVTVLGRLAGATAQSAPFTDVPTGAYYAGYVGWAAAQGIVSGVGGGHFAPEEEITREQLCCMIHRFAGSRQVSLPPSQAAVFADDAMLSSWARESVYRCRAAGLVTGKGNERFDPQGSATRAEVAVILHAYCKKYQ